MIQITASDAWTDIPSDNRIFGNFVESGFGRQVSGMWSEMLYNRAFRTIPPYLAPTWEWLGIRAESYDENAPFWHSGYEESDWKPIGAPVLRHTCGSHTFKGLSSLQISNTVEGKYCGLVQDGLHLQEGRSYRLRLFAGIEGRISQAGLNGFGISQDSDQSNPLRVILSDFQAECQLTAVCREYEWTFAAKRTETASLSLAFDWAGTLVLVYSSLMPADNLMGWRKDVVEKIREVAPPVVRFPGGCFVSFYNWESSVGSRDAREPMPSYYWGGLEENDVGLDEFAGLAELAGFRMQICFNMMSSTPFKARQLVEYLNAPEEVGMGRLRMLNGHRAAYGVRLFEMDNEPGRKWTARQYAEQCVLFSREMKLADPGIEFLFAAYDYPPEALASMLEIVGPHVDYVIYRQGEPDFVEKVLPIIRSYNAVHGTNLRLVNTEWLPSCRSIEPFDDPAVPVDFQWHGEITNDYRTIFSTQQRSWNYALNGAHRLLDYIGYGGMFALANFNNLCNTWGQNVIEATKDACYLSCMGEVFSFFRRNFETCFACDTKTGDERIRAQLTRSMDGTMKLYLVNHAGSMLQARLPEGGWVVADAIACSSRLEGAGEVPGRIFSCRLDLHGHVLEVPPLSIVCLRADCR
jgi:hypothetical protein